MSTILDEIRYLVAGAICFDRDHISEKSRLVEDLGADSLDAVEILMSIEEFFGIMVEDGKLDEIKTVGDIEAYVRVAIADRELQADESE